MALISSKDSCVGFPTVTSTTIAGDGANQKAGCQLRLILRTLVIGNRLPDESIR